MVKHYVFVLPTWGAPYISAVVDKDSDEHLSVLQKAVRGPIETIHRSNIKIHPMFSRENSRWNTARQLITTRVNVYVNEEGIAKHCAPNMATINVSAIRSGCPNFLGDVAIDVPEKVITALGIKPDAFTLIAAKHDAADEYPVWEFEDDEDCEAQKALWAAEYPQFACLEITGYGYKSKI